MGSNLDRIIHKHRRSGPVLAPVLSAPVSQMFWRVSRIRHARGLESLFSWAALGLRLRVREVGLVPGPQVLRAFERRVLPGLGLADPVDGLVGVLDDMEPVDGFGRVGRVSADGPWRIAGSCRTSPGRGQAVLAGNLRHRGQTQPQTRQRRQQNQAQKRGKAHRGAHNDQLETGPRPTRGRMPRTNGTLFIKHTPNTNNLTSSISATVGRGLRTFSWRPNGRIFVCSVLRNESVRWSCISPRR